MKKITVFCFVLSLLFVFASCAGINQPEPALETEFRVSIDLATDEFLMTFHDRYEFDYTLVRRVLWPGGEHITGDRLVIWANTPLRNFALITIGNDVIGDEIIFIPIDTFAFLNELPVGAAFVINSYISGGTIPWSGISFLDENNVQRYFLLLQDQSDAFEAYRLIEFMDRREELPDGWSPWW